jgi:bacterioferritin-associated ferredoxin
MIVCSCNILTKAQILEAAEMLQREQPGRALTPARIYRFLQMRAQCTVCFALVRRIVMESGLAVTCPEPLGSGAEDEKNDALYG